MILLIEKEEFVGFGIEDLMKIMTPPCESDCYQLANPKKQQFTETPEQADVLNKLFANKVNGLTIMSSAPLFMIKSCSADKRNLR